MGYLDDTKTNIKINLFLLIPFGIFVALALASFVLISQASEMKDWLKDLLLGLGTGSASSSIVSLSFFINDICIKKRSISISRSFYLNNFKILLHDFVEDFCFDLNEDGTFTFEEFVKKQHRWFHEYYKAMVADSGDAVNTSIRKKQLEQFIKKHEVYIDYCFNLSNLDSCSFSEFTKSEFWYLFYDFREMKYCLKTKQMRLLFFYAASFFEIIKRLPTEVGKFKSFSLIRFIVQNGHIKFDYSDFEEKEPILKFRRTFSETRYNNYKNEYKKKSI